jgi:signal transduction histidine kinase
MSPAPSEAPAVPDATVDPAGPARLRTFVLADAVLTGASVVFMLVVWATVFPSGWLLVVALMVSLSGCVMLSALAPLRRQLVEPAVMRLAVANWAIAIGATAVATFAWPIAVFASLLPAVVSVPHVSRRAFHRYLGVSLAVATGVVALGLLQDVTGLTGEAPVWVLEAVTITFVPGMALLLIELSLANRAHLQRMLESSLAANDDLRRSEEALAEAVDELRASRARVVAATDEERRRIARDLHDGSQQRLAALGLNLSVVRELVRRSPDDAAQALEELRGSITEAQADLRALVHGIYPPALTEHGIVAALGSVAAGDASRVRVVANGVGRHPAHVEAAVYFCCTEALQNAAKHAGPEASVTVTVVEPEPGWLGFEVEDDGHGFDSDTARGGAGFVSMRDRVGALGGSLEVISAPGEGTRVRGNVRTASPDGSAAPAGPEVAGAQLPL